MHIPKEKPLQQSFAVQQKKIIIHDRIQYVTGINKSKLNTCTAPPIFTIMLDAEKVIVQKKFKCKAFPA